MKTYRLIADVSKLVPNLLIFYCVDANGNAVRGVTETLLTLIEYSSWHPVASEQLSALAKQFRNGEYVSPDASLPDFNFNDVCLWLSPQFSTQDALCITNENTQYSLNEQPQTFSMHQYDVAAALWSSFQSSRARGETIRMECDFPIPANWA